MGGKGWRRRGWQRSPNAIFGGIQSIVNGVRLSFDPV